MCWSFPRPQANRESSFPVRLDRVLNEALVLCRPVFGDREVILNLMDDPPEVLGQPSGLRSVLVNLLNNVGKYAEGAGVIRISLSVVRSGRRRALAMAISNPLADQSDADPERWFEPFQRGRAAVDRAYSRHRDRTFSCPEYRPAAWWRAVGFSMALAPSGLPSTCRWETSKMVARLLVIEDEPGLLMTLEDRFRAEGF